MTGRRCSAWHAYVSRNATVVTLLLLLGVFPLPAMAQEAPPLHKPHGPALFAEPGFMTSALDWAARFSDGETTNDELRTDRDHVERWYVVRDLGTALGESARVRPERSNPDVFARTPFITGVADGFVQFGAYGCWHEELVRNRIAPTTCAGP
jgi:hypothetical protein